MLDSNKLNNYTNRGLSSYYKNAIKYSKQGQKSNKYPNFCTWFFYFSGYLGTCGIRGDVASSSSNHLAVDIEMWLFVPATSLSF